MIGRISVLLLFCCSISVASLIFLRTRLSSDRKHLSIPDLTASVWKNCSCVLGITMSDSDNFLMAESSIWWVVLSDINDVFCAW